MQQEDITIGCGDMALSPQGATALATQAFACVARALNLQECALAPRNINIETVHGCNGNCRFCAASTQAERSSPEHGSRMNVGLFKTIVDQLAHMDFGGRVSFHVNNEPLLDEEVSGRVSMLRAGCPNATLRLMTNGILLKDALARDLLSNGLDVLDVSNYSDSKRLHGLILSLQGQFGPTRVREFHRRSNVILFNRAGSSPAAHPYDGAFRRTGCVYPFLQLNIAYDGRVGQCCHDFWSQGLLGSLVNRRLLEIWNGPEARALRRQLLAGNRTPPLCEGCDYPGVPRDIVRETQPEIAKTYDRLFPEN